MICNVKRSQLDGVIKCPPSKSYTHRAIFLASLAEGKSTIYNPLLSNDTRATISACEKFGARIENNDKRLEINGTREIKAANIDVANSGTSMRIAAAIASLAKGTSILSGDESLSKRPMGSLLKALYLLGAQIDSNDGMPPVTITGTIKGGRVEIPGNVSSQYVSALLIAGGATSEGIMVDIDGLLVSKDYVGYTIETMKRFGAKVDTTDSGYSCIGQKYRAAEFTVPYDMSILALLVAMQRCSLVKTDEDLIKSHYQMAIAIDTRCRFAQCHGSISRFANCMSTEYDFKKEMMQRLIRASQHVMMHP